MYSFNQRFPEAVATASNARFVRKATGIVDKQQRTIHVGVFQSGGGIGNSDDYYTKKPPEVTRLKTVKCQ